MAATVSAWGKPGAWALDSEENESQLKQQSVNDGGDGGGVAAAISDFPSLATAAAAKTKKKKPQTLSLQEFSTYSSAKPVQSVGLTPDEMISLPTGPRERTAEELDRSRLGGGFKSYGSSYDRPGRGSSDEPRRRGGFGRDDSREFTPSRADETDDWGASKKFTPGNGFERRERGERVGFFSDSNSRADGSDNWAANKSFVPSEGRRIERRGGFESNGGGGANSDNWTKRKEDESLKFGAFDSLREKRGSRESMNNVSDPEAWGRKKDDSNGRPRLNLQPRTIPIGEGQQNDNGTPLKPKASNPFGEARPREEVLKEKGQDWKEIDQKLESLKIKEAGKKSSGSSKEGASPEKRTERSWRRFDVNDDTHSRSESTVNGSSEEAGAGECKSPAGAGECKSYAEACQQEN